MAIAAWKDTAVRDIGYAFRQFIRNPVFTLVAIISLALGIGGQQRNFQHYE